MYAQVVYLISLLLHLSVKAQTTLPVLSLTPGITSWAGIFLTVIQETVKQSGNSSPISFWGTGACRAASSHVKSSASPASLG